MRIRLNTEIIIYAGSYAEAKKEFGDAAVITIEEYIALSHNPNRTDDEDNAFKDYNKFLIARYPWLTPRNKWSGKSIVDCANGEKGFWPQSPDDISDYDYEWTELDDMPDGWRIAFGEALCEEIDRVIHEEGWDSTFRITQIKEKFGTLRFYTNVYSSKLMEVISKYEVMSAHVCIGCGAPATHKTTVWIQHLCDECYTKLGNF